MTRTGVAQAFASVPGGHPGKPLGRLLGVCQLAVGVALTVRPEQTAASAAGPHGRAVPAWLVRTLGVRSLVQGVVTIVRPHSTVLTVGALVDATHAASMIPVVAFSPPHRRAASVSAVAAAISAVVGARVARRATPVGEASQ